MMAPAEKGITGVAIMVEEKMVDGSFFLGLESTGGLAALEVTGEVVGSEALAGVDSMEVVPGAAGNSLNIRSFRSF